jgi:hypothetical protein
MNSRRSNDLGYSSNGWHLADLYGRPLLESHKPTKRQLRLNKKIGTLLVAIKLGEKPLRVYRDTSPDEIRRMVNAKINALNRAQPTQERVVSRKKKGGRAKNASH